MSSDNKLDGTNVLVQNSVPLPLIYIVIAICASLYLNIVSVKTIGGIFGLLVIGIALIVYYQENILYIPVIQGWKTPADNPSGYQSPSQQRLKYEDIYFKTSDGLKLHGWFIPSTASDANKQPTLLFCHENAGNIGLRIPEFQKINSLLRVNQFVFDYRGYGFSEGIPSEEGLIEDTMSAFRLLIETRQDIDPNKILITGRSLGGAVAIAACHKLQRLDEHAVKPLALIVENSFTSINDMVDAKFPILNIPFFKEFFLRLHWKSDQLIKELGLPILFLSSKNDEIVPYNQMKKLHHNANQSKYKSFHDFNTTHNDIWAAAGIQYWNAKKTFLNSQCQCDL
mmetsp:Transcript_21178/g.25036  ORF Transcript_21178/g.25036 Transcript_21178/m.25036 type:complete len:340 (+) Transcript_21178:69-1088(+)